MTDVTTTTDPTILAQLKAEFSTVAGTRIAWFLAGVFIAGHDVAAVTTALRTFVGI